MEFRDLKKQYQILKPEMDKAIEEVLMSSRYISGPQVSDLEKELAEYVGVKHCISCANGTDALSLAMMAWDIKEGDAVFVPDFTFFSSGEIVSFAGATPIFVDVDEDTFNLSSDSLTQVIENVIEEGILCPKAIVAVDLFGQPADFDCIKPIAEKYGLKILEDGAQGFGGEIRGRKACSFGDISTTSFFPAKPLGCYGDGGAVFTDDDELAELLRSIRVHGKGADKYDNVRIGMNSRLDTVQAAILQVKFKAFKEYELEDINVVAERYTRMLDGIVKTPTVKVGFYSSWAQYSILLEGKEQRDGLQNTLKEKGIPSMVYYKKPMHVQDAFSDVDCVKGNLSVTESICDRVLALPIHPYMTEEEQMEVVEVIKAYVV